MQSAKVCYYNSMAAMGWKTATAVSLVALLAVFARWIAPSFDQSQAEARAIENGSTASTAPLRLTAVPGSFAPPLIETASDSASPAILPTIPGSFTLTSGQTASQSFGSGYVQTLTLTSIVSSAQGLAASLTTSFSCDGCAQTSAAIMPGENFAPAIILLAQGQSAKLAAWHITLSSLTPSAATFTAFYEAEYAAVVRPSFQSSTYGPAPYSATFTSWILPSDAPAYRIDFGDGQTGSVPSCPTVDGHCAKPGTISHLYSTAGRYIPTLVGSTGLISSGAPITVIDDH
jgi:hypothetical protein